MSEISEIHDVGAQPGDSLRPSSEASRGDGSHVHWKVFYLYGQDCAWGPATVG